ncbi:conserved hypothetical protein [Gammaproteobacteria bacterium]
MQEDSQIETFISIFKDFLNDVYTCYPETALYVFKVFIDGLSKTNPIYIVNTFSENIEPYKEFIITRNEDFFISNKEVFKDDNQKFAGHIDKIINIWKSKDTPPKTKECIWRYMTLLVKLSDKINCNGNGSGKK